MSDTDPRTWVTCRLCKGTGWVACVCLGLSFLVPSRYEGLTVKPCAKGRKHNAHTYVERCDCRRVPA